MKNINATITLTKYYNYIIQCAYSILRKLHNSFFYEITDSIRFHTVK